VRDGVQGQNRGQGLIHLVKPQLSQYMRSTRIFFPQTRNVGRGDTQKHGLGHGTEKRESKRKKDYDYKQEKICAHDRDSVCSMHFTASDCRARKKCASNRPRCRQQKYVNKSPSFIHGKIKSPPLIRNPRHLP
jgi:hypothetical protein